MLDDENNPEKVLKSLQELRAELHQLVQNREESNDKRRIAMINEYGNCLKGMQSEIQDIQQVILKLEQVYEAAKESIDMGRKQIVNVIKNICEEYEIEGYLPHGAGEEIKTSLKVLRKIFLGEDANEEGEVCQDFKEIEHIETKLGKMSKVAQKKAHAEFDKLKKQLFCIEKNMEDKNAIEDRLAEEKARLKHFSDEEEQMKNILDRLSQKVAPDFNDKKNVCRNISNSFL